MEIQMCYKLCTILKTKGRKLVKYLNSTKLGPRAILCPRANREAGAAGHSKATIPTE